MHACNCARRPWAICDPNAQNCSYLASTVLDRWILPIVLAFSNQRFDNLTAISMVMIRKYVPTFKHCRLYFNAFYVELVGRPYFNPFYACR